MSRARATSIGFAAVILWSLLALFTVGSAPVPPFQLNAMCFAIGGTIGLFWAMRSGGLAQLTAIRWPVWAMGIGGLFGYHFFYFSALRAAPPAEAGLIAYLWPLLIVVFSGALPGETLKRGHVLGAVVGFAGAALIVLQSGGAQADGTAGAGEPGRMVGYGLALLCALIWSGYSVLSRLAGDTPTQSVAVFCLASAALSLVAHLLFETTAWPSDPRGWGAVLALGLGPVGLAFYLWDVGVKRGDIQLLGVASYGAPLLSTAVLVLTGFADPGWILAISAALVTGGAVIAARAGR